MMLGIERERPRDAEPLALAAGELVRIVVHLRRPQAHALKQRRDALGDFVSPHVLEILDCLADDRAGAQPRIERRIGILEDELDVAPIAPHRARRKRRNIDAAQTDGTAARIDQPHDHPRERGFAAAGFADDAERFPLAQGERDAVDRVNEGFRAAERTAAHRKALHEILDREQRHAGCGPVVCETFRHRPPPARVPRASRRRDGPAASPPAAGPRGGRAPWRAGSAAQSGSP